MVLGFYDFDCCMYVCVLDLSKYAGPTLQSTPIYLPSASIQIQHVLVVLKMNSILHIGSDKKVELLSVFIVTEEPRSHRVEVFLPLALITIQTIVVSELVLH